MKNLSFLLAAFFSINGHTSHTISGPRRGQIYNLQGYVWVDTAKEGNMRVDTSGDKNKASYPTFEIEKIQDDIAIGTLRIPPHPDRYNNLECISRGTVIGVGTYRGVRIENHLLGDIVAPASPSERQALAECTQRPGQTHNVNSPRNWVDVMLDYGETKELRNYNNLTFEIENIRDGIAIGTLRVFPSLECFTNPGGCINSGAYKDVRISVEYLGKAVPPSLLAERPKRPGQTYNLQRRRSVWVDTAEGNMLVDTSRDEHGTTYQTFEIEEIQGGIAIGTLRIPPHPRRYKYNNLECISRGTAIGVGTYRGVRIENHLLGDIVAPASPSERQALAECTKRPGQTHNVNAPNAPINRIRVTLANGEIKKLRNYNNMTFEIREIQGDIAIGALRVLRSPRCSTNPGNCINEGTYREVKIEVQYLGKAVAPSP